jgi:hypothetical protein
MIVNIAVTEVLFGVALVGGVVLWWPDVRWGVLAIAAIAAIAINALVPVLFYPWSRRSGWPSTSSSTGWRFEAATRQRERGDRPRGPTSTIRGSRSEWPACRARARAAASREVNRLGSGEEVPSRTAR